MKRLSLNVIAFALLFCAGVFAQTSAGVGGITGIVTDSSGATVPNAQVVVDNPELGVQRVLHTTSGGLFNAPTLVPHSGYEVTINAPGFAQFQTRDITVLVGQDVSIQAALQVKSSSTNVEVSAPVVDTVKTDVSTDITQKQIDNLPINGRRVDQFVLLTPSVVPDGTFGDVSFRGTPGGNTFLVDGNDTTDQFYMENSGRTRIPTQISQDAVQEFQVVTDAYSAEYGRAIGGVINTVTRSGTNEFHGTGFWFFRNRTLEARDRYAGFNPPEYRHQVGGTISGPIIKDKLFFLFNTEEQIRNFPLVSSIISPSALNSNTTWKGCGVAGGGLPAATSAQCAAINALLPSFFTTLPRTADQQTGFGKIDWRPTDKNSVSFSFNYQHFYSPNGIQTGAVVTSGGAFNSNGNDTVADRYGRIDWTYVPTANTVNELRLGWFKDRQADDVNSSLINPDIGTISLSVNRVAIGFANYLPRIEPSENRYEAADDLSWTVGKHNFKFGVDYLNTEDYTYLIYGANGSYSYNSANAFALDYSGNTTGRRDYASYTQAFGNPVADTRIQDVDAYAQDQYRVIPSLTLYYGARYERSLLPQPGLFNPLVPQTGFIHQSRLNFAPRFGFAWSADSKTVIRSGYGIYYGRYSSSLINTLFTANNVYQESLSIFGPNSTTGPIFPAILSTPTGSPGSASVEYASPNLRTPYTEQADFSVQRQIDSHTSMTVSYLWSRGAQFFTVRDANLGAPTGLMTYKVFNAAGVQTGTFTSPEYLSIDRINPNFQHMYEVENGGNNYYNGLTLQVQRRFATSFDATLAYTWSHAIDDNLGGGSSNIFFSSTSATLFNGDYQGVKGDSSLDQRHRLVVNWIWSPIFTSSTTKWARYFINNWQLAAITTIASQLPTSETINVLSTPSGLAFPGTNLNGFNGTSLVPWLGVNTLRIDDTWRVDARLSKILPITERVKATLQFEVFNLTNTITNTSISTVGYNANWSTSTGGVITPATGLGVGTQSAGFPDGTNARRAQASLRLEF